MENLRDFFVHEIREIYDAEHQVLEMLKKIVKEVGSDALRTEFEKELNKTEGRIQRLEGIAYELGIDLEGEKSIGMRGLVNELNVVLKDHEDEDTQDAALLAAYQKIQHYAIATYGTLRSYAHLLKCALTENYCLQSLQEEKQTDRRLTKLAERQLNPEAVH